MSTSPIKDVTFGNALKISLDNYYDLLKTQVGGLKSEEYLQLKLVADTVDVSKDEIASQGGYRWFSYYNLLERNDKSIVPNPVSGGVHVSNASLTATYARFLRRLRNYVVVKELSFEEQQLIADYDVKIDSKLSKVEQYEFSDRRRWFEYADIMGFERTDQSAYKQWSRTKGHLQQIQFLESEIRDLQFKKQSILAKSYTDQDDQDIIDAESDFLSTAMKLRYPTSPDHMYDSGDKFSVEYLASLPTGNTALYDDRHFIGVNQSLNNIRTNNTGKFEASFDRATSESESITTDWKASGSARYGFFKVKASVSQHKAITEDFSKGTELTIGAKSAFKLGITPAGWFKPVLFTHKYVRENIQDFEEFFGSEGTLLYYPTAMILVRGFSISFESSQNWAYDYKKNFSASGGGGLRAFGVNFGASTSYSKNIKVHKIDQSNTTLKISDDEESIRFVGYAVQKNTVYFDEINKNRPKDIVG